MFVCFIGSKAFLITTKGMSTIVSCGKSKVFQLRPLVSLVTHIGYLALTNANFNPININVVNRNGIASSKAVKSGQK